MKRKSISNKTSVKDAEYSDNSETSAFSGAGRNWTQPLRFKNISELIAKHNKVRQIRGTGQAFANIIRQYERQPYNVDGRVRPNFGTLRGKIDKVSATFLDFATERERWASISTDYGEDDALMGMWNEHIASAFQKFCLGRWKDSFSSNMLAIRDMLLASKGAFFFDDDFSCYPKQIPIHHVLPDSSASMFPDSFDVLFVHRRMSVINLYRKIKNEETLQSSGWDRNAVLELLKTTQAGWRSLSHESLFMLFGKGGVTQMQQDATIDLVYAFVEEYDEGEDKKGVSQFIYPMLRHEAGTTQNQNDEKRGYLFYKKNKLSCMDQAIAIVAHTVCNNFYEDISFAQLIYTFSKTYDMVMNRVLDGIEDNMRVYLQSDSNETRESLARMRHGQWQVLKPGVKLVQDRIVRPVMESLQVLTKLNVDTNASFGQYTVGEQEGRGMPKTAKQAEIDFGEAQNVSSAQVKLFNCYYSRLIEQIYRRFVTLGKSSQLTEKEQKNFDLFKSYLKRNNVPDDAWYYENVIIESIHLAGAGSPSEKLKAAGIVQNALSIPVGTPGERLNQRQMIAAAVGVANVNSYLPPDDSVNIPEDSLIGVENDALSTPDCNPNNVVVLSNHMHMRHIPRHIDDASTSMQVAGKLFQALNQMPPDDAGVYLVKIQDILLGVDNKLAHCQAHMEIAKRNKNPHVQNALSQAALHINQINQAQDALEKAVGKAQLARQKQQQDQQLNPTPEMNHAAAMFQMKEQHAARMMDFEYNNAQMKAEQLRVQSGENALHKKNIETTLGIEDAKLKALQHMIKISVTKNSRK